MSLDEGEELRVRPLPISELAGRVTLRSAMTGAIPGTFGEVRSTGWVEFDEDLGVESFLAEQWFNGEHWFNGFDMEIERTEPSDRFRTL